MPAFPLPAEDFDIERYKGLPAHELMVAMRRDLEYKLPPKGMTVQVTRMGGREWRRYTWRCSREGCWYMCTPRSEANARELEQDHLAGKGFSPCPTPPRRELLPSGSSEVEKLWREIDDVVEAIKKNESYRNMTGEGLKGFVKGLAFCIVMKDKEYFPDIRSVAVEAERRWKMHHGLAPWESTKTHHTNNHDGGSAPGGGWVPTDGWQTGKTPAKKATPRVPALSQAKINQIKTAHGSGMFTDPNDIALMCGVTVTQVKQVIGGS